jgi:hypothetical protein
MQNPLTCHSEERSDEESRILPEKQLKTETLRYAQSDMNLICIQTLAIYATKDSYLARLGHFVDTTRLFRIKSLG